MIVFHLLIILLFFRCKKNVCLEIDVDESMRELIVVPSTFYSNIIHGLYWLSATLVTVSTNKIYNIPLLRHRRWAAYPYTTPMLCNSWKIENQTAQGRIGLTTPLSHKNPCYRLVCDLGWDDPVQDTSIDNASSKVEKTRTVTNHHGVVLEDSVEVIIILSHNKSVNVLDISHLSVGDDSQSAMSGYNSYGDNMSFQHAMVNATNANNMNSFKYSKIIGINNSSAMYDYDTQMNIGGNGGNGTQRDTFSSTYANIITTPNVASPTKDLKNRYISSANDSLASLPYCNTTLAQPSNNIEQTSGHTNNKAKKSQVFDKNAHPYFHRIGCYILSHAAYNELRWSDSGEIVNCIDNKHIIGTLVFNTGRECIRKESLYPSMTSYKQSEGRIVDVVLLPCTWLAGLVGDFSLQVLSNKPCTLMEYFPPDNVSR
jgi:hypothetical protein